MFDSIESAEENRQLLAEAMFAPEQAEDALQAAEISTDSQLWLAALLSEARDASEPEALIGDALDSTTSYSDAGGVALPSGESSDSTQFIADAAVFLVDADLLTEEGELFVTENAFSTEEISLQSDSSLHEQLAMNEWTDVDATGAPTPPEDALAILNAPIDENSDLNEVPATGTLEEQPIELPVLIVDPIYEWPEPARLPILEEIPKDQVIAEEDLEVHMPYERDSDQLVTMPYQIDPDQAEQALNENQDVTELPEIAVCFEEFFPAYWTKPLLIFIVEAPTECWEVITPWPWIHCIADNYRDKPPERVVFEGTSEVELSLVPCCDLPISEITLAETQIILPGCAPNQLIATPELLTI